MYRALQTWRGADALMMADNGVTCSMSRSGNVRDNAAMKNVFLSMKTERKFDRTGLTHIGR